MSDLAYSHISISIPGEQASPKLKLWGGGGKYFFPLPKNVKMSILNNMAIIKLKLCKSDPKPTLDQFGSALALT